MSQQPDLNWRPVLKSRLLVAAAALVLWVVGIEARLVVLQVFERSLHVGSELRARLESEQIQLLGESSRSQVQAQLLGMLEK